MIGVRSPDGIDAMPRRHTVGRLAVSANDRPDVAPITYAHDGVSVYAFSGPGRKIDVKRKQPPVRFEPDEVAGLAEWRSVVAEGVYEELTADPARRQALALLGITSGAVARSLGAGRRNVVFRVRLTERMTGLWGYGVG